MSLSCFLFSSPLLLLLLPVARALDLPTYNLVLDGLMDLIHPQHPPLPAPIKPRKPTGTATRASAAAAAAPQPWEALFAPMRSAYREADYPNKPAGREPQFTNYAWSAFMPDEPFAGTLDYLFLSELGWGPVQYVKPLPALADVKAEHPVGFPVASEPSDHVLLAAELVLLDF